MCVLRKRWGREGDPSSCQGAISERESLVGRYFISDFRIIMTLVIECMLRIDE